MKLYLVLCVAVAIVAAVRSSPLITDQVEQRAGIAPAKGSNQPLKRVVREPRFSGRGGGGVINGPQTQAGGRGGGVINGPQTQTGGRGGGVINGPQTQTGGGGGVINGPQTQTGGGGGVINGPQTMLGSSRYRQG